MVHLEIIFSMKNIAINSTVDELSNDINATAVKGSVVINTSASHMSKKVLVMLS